MKSNIVEKTKERYLEYERRHQDILDAAITLFNTKGYAATTTAKIAKKANVTERTMYRHFKNKQDLFTECIYSILNQLNETYQKELEKNKDDDLGYLKSISTAYINFVIDNPNKSMFLVHLYTYRAFPELDEGLKRFIEGMITEAEAAIKSMKKKGILKSPIHPRLLAGVFISQYFTMVFLNEFIDKKLFNPETAIQLAKNVMGIT